MILLNGTRAPGRAVRSTPQRLIYLSASQNGQYTALYGVLAPIPGAADRTVFNFLQKAYLKLY